MSNLQAQSPAEGISVQDKWGDAMTFHVECSCTDPEHAHVAWVEVGHEGDIPEVEVTIFVETGYRGWQNWRKRIRDAWGVLTGGRIMRNHSILLTPQAAFNYQAALKKAAEDIQAKYLPNQVADNT